MHSFATSLKEVRVGDISSEAGCKVVRGDKRTKGTRHCLAHSVHNVP